MVDYDQIGVRSSGIPMHGSVGVDKNMYCIFFFIENAKNKTKRRAPRLKESNSALLFIAIGVCSTLKLHLPSDNSARHQ